ncbi:bifunctional metallophosphatase/5'-nucleotidase [Devosia sp.]|uniref:bifunctional metallophosphatase/5'-nucleotidase n=1 Tax=Devosia sp. TaxID=1871048 RepID=UPI003A919AC2
MKRLLLGASALALTAGFSGAAQAEFTLNILHFNDFHSRFQPITGSGSDCSAEDDAAGECFGGIARLKTGIDTARADAGDDANIVLLSAGDEFQGSLFYTQYKSEIIADFLNDLDIDVAATGNHEFDDGPEEFAKYIDAAEHPIIGGNFDVSAEPLLAGKINGVIVLNVGGEKIGIIGALAEDTVDTSSPGDNVKFQSAIDYIQGASDALAEGGVNKVILLSHVGYAKDQEIAAATTGIDLIVGGHSHTLLSNTDEDAEGAYPTMVANSAGTEVPIVQAGAYAKYLGDLTVTWDDDGNVISAEGDPMLLDASVTPDEDFTTRLAEMAGPLEELRAEVIGTATAMIEGDRNVCRVQECEMGNLVADAQLDRVADQGVTISIANSGGLRASIDEGEITMGEVLTVLPFSNTLATFELSGDDIVASLENGLSQIEDIAGRFPQVAGLKYTFDKTQPAGSRLVGDVMVNEGGEWVAIDPDKTYGVVTNNYVRNGGDGYTLFETDAVNPYDFGPPLERVVADYIAELGGEYTPYTDGRITDASPEAAMDEEMAAEEDAAMAAEDVATEGVSPEDSATEAPVEGDAMATEEDAAMAAEDMATEGVSPDDTATEAPAMDAPAMDAPAMEAPAMDAPAEAPASN